MWGGGNHTFPTVDMLGGWSERTRELEKMRKKKKKGGSEDKDEEYITGDEEKKTNG